MRSAKLGLLIILLLASMQVDFAQISPKTKAPLTFTISRECDGGLCHFEIVSFDYGRDSSISVGIGDSSLFYYFSVRTNEGDVIKEYIYTEESDKHFIEKVSGARVEAALNKLLLDVYKLGNYIVDNEITLKKRKFAEKGRFLVLADLRNYTKSARSSVNKTKKIVPSAPPYRKISLVPFLKEDKWGFSDPNRKIIIGAKYEKVDFFTEGLARVKLNGHYGFIDTKGKVVIPFVYDNACSFNEGLACVIINHKWGSIDRSGNLVVPIKYDDVGWCKNGIVPIWFNGKSGALDNLGREIIPPKYQYSIWFHEGLALVMLNGKYGFIDKKGEEVIPFKYDYAHDFAGGLAGAQLNGKWGFIDKNGNSVIPFVYDYVFPFQYDLTFVKLNGKFGFIDKAGRLVIPLEYEDAGLLGYGLGFPSDNLVNLKLNGKWGYLDTKGKTVVPFIYDWAGGFRAGIAPVKLNGKYGFIDKTGKVITPFIYDSARNDGEGMAIVRLNGKYGFIDTTGKVVVPIKYDHPDGFPHTGLFKNGLANMIFDSKEIYIDKKGKEFFDLSVGTTASVSGAAGMKTSVPYGLPSTIRNLLNKNYAGWKLNQGVKNCASRPVVSGDFDGNGKIDYAVMFTTRSKGFIVAFLATGISYKALILETNSASNMKDYFLALAQKGEEYAEIINDNFDRVTRQTLTDAPVSGLCESSAYLYIYEKGIFKRAFVSD
jgi:hypothetical protein